MGCPLENILLNLSKCSDFEARNEISNIKKYFNEELSKSDLDCAFSRLFAEVNGIITFLSKKLRSKDYGTALVETFELLEYIVIHFHEKTDHHILDIKNVCMSCIVLDQTSADLKESSFDVLKTIFENGPWGHDLEIPSIITKLIQQLIRKKPKPKVLQKEYHVLGVIARRHPEHMAHHSDTLLRLFLDDLDFQTTRASSVSFPLIAGCLNGLTEFLYSFSQSPEDSPENCRRIYTYVKKLSEPGQGRRVAQRAALNLVSIHGCQLSQHLYKDYQLWHETLLKWLDLGDKDCKVAIKALDSFYRQIARTLHESKHGNEQAVFQYFMKFFKEKMLSASTSKQEIHIIIKGFGLFAGPCQTHMDPKDVTFMFTLIVQQAEQLYMKETSDKDNSLYHLADYVESLASIIIQLGNVSTDQLAALQRVTILLVQRFPDLPQSLHHPAIYSFTATCQNLVNCSLSLLNMFLSKVVYQGVIRTCSHPRAALVESQKDQASTGANKLVSYKSYLPLWTALLQIQQFDKTELPLVVKQSIINNIYDEFVKTVITLTGKLNLETKNKTAIEDDIQVLDPETGLEPCCQKDFQVFFNLVDLFCDLITSADANLFEKWIQPFLHRVVLQSLHRPIISGFYKLIAVSMHLCVKLQYFKNYCGDLSDHRRPCYLLLSKFLLGLLAHCKQYKGDLQVSCLQTILETPAELVQPLIPQAISAFQVMFRLGHSVLSLAQQALTTLEQWCQLLPAEDMKPLLNAVLPELDPYLQSSGFEGDIEEAIDRELIKPSKNLSKNRTTRLTRKTLIERPETELSKLQRRIVIFLGCLETDTCLSLIEGGKKVQCDVWDSSQHLAYAIPFIDMKPSIDIDNILPHVIELCLSCSDRQTRIVACEFLHAVIMYMLGTNLKMEVSKPGYLSKMFSHMVMPLLQLGCDSDQIVHQLYHPLMLQLAHWYSSAVQLGSVHTQILIDTLMDGITHPTDTALRDYSAKCLREFVIWSIKQSRAKDLEKSQTNIKAVLKKMFSLCVHPCPTKRLGGALVFNSIYSVLREEKSILEIFWLEILYYLVSNLAMTDGPDSNSVNVNSPQVVLALDHVERVFLEKPALFTQVNSKRRTPPGFLGSCLVDVVMWLLHQCSSSSPDCRHKCMHMVCRICLKLPGISSVAAYMNMYNQSQLLDICEKKTMVSTSPSSDAAGGSRCDQIVRWLNRLLTSLDCYVWLLGEDFVPLHKLFQVPENAQPTIKIFQALTHFIEHVCSVPLSEILGRDAIYLLPRDEERYNRTKCFVTVRLCDFTRAILQHPDGSIYIPSTFPITKLWTLVATCIFHPSKVGFDMRSIEVLEKLPGNLEDLLQVIKNTDCFEELVKTIDEIMGDGYEQLLNELQYNLKNDLIPEWQTLYTQGMCTVQISGLIEYLKIDISAEKVVTAIFSALVETDGSSKMLIPLQPTAQAYAESLLKFAFLLHNQVDILVELVMNDSKLLTHHSQTSLSHGEHFLLTFKTAILSHWLVYPEHCVGLLLERVDSRCGRMVLGVLTEFLQFAARNKRHKHRVSTAAEKVVTNRWDTLQEWGSAKPDNAYRLLGVLCDMAATQQNAIGCLMKHKSVCDWVMIQISSQNLTMNHKNHALDLLPCLTSPAEDINHELTTSLKALKHQHFPHRSSELVKDSLEYTGFMLAFHKLLTGLEVTGSRVLLHAVVASSASDPHHICEDSIQRTLKSFICRLQKEDQLKAVEVPYQVFLSTDYDPVIRLGAVERFCRSMLLRCSEAVVRQFLCSHVQTLRGLLDEKLSGASGMKNEHQLVGKIGAWMLMGVMFSQLDPQELESVDCPITRAAMTGPVTTGKELIVHLTKGAFNARCENTPPALGIDSRVPDLFRRYQCTAYNTLVTIVSNTKRSAAELKFYQGFLFTENRDKNQLLWEKLVDCSRTYTFPMDWEEIPKRRKKMVGIRRMACQSGSTEVNYLPTHSQYLFDSTLREDVTQFDFTTSLVLSEGVTLPHSDVTASLEVTLESDSLNEHECMSTLCGLIQHMVQCGISPLPQENEQPTSLPGWMDMLKKSLEDEYKHKNAKVFILKLIVNCETVFKPYAKFWLSPIMKAILDRCAGTDLNYFLTDIIAMLLSWHDVAIPQSSDVFASEILHFLIANIHHNRRDIFKHNLEVIKTLVEVWKPCLSIPKQQLLDGIVPKGGPDSRDTETGIQLVGVMLANNIHPWSETGKKLFLDKLLSNLDSNQREVYLPCAEVIGMSLKLLGTNLNIAQPLESDSSFLENVNSKLNKIKIHDKLDKFIFCLHGIYKHFSTIVDNFMPVILFHIKKMAGMFRVLSLEMIHSRLVTIQQSLYLTLVDVGLMEYLTNRESDVQELALKIVSQAAPRIEPTQLALIFPEVCRFGSHGVLACRRVMYEIAMWVYTEFRQRIDESDVEMSLFEESKVILLRGLVDSDSALQETVFKFWNTDTHFPAGTAHRLITLLTELYSPRTEPNFLAYSTQLLLEATALGPDFSRKIFDHPLSACKFEDLKVLVSWRAQHTSIAPMFAETFVSQPNTQAPGSLDMVVRATQTSLEFQPTLGQGEDVVDASNTSFSSFASSSLLFTVGSLGDKSRRARRGDQQLDNSAEVVNPNPSSSYLRRRFLKDKEKIRIGFASREILRKHRREEHLKERAKKREATVNMYRSYRIGDLPDIEILHSALIQPLRVLAKRDSSIGRRLLVSLFSGILVEMGDGADWFTARSSGALGDILSSSTLSCPPVIGTVLEIALANNQHINLDVESITTASRSSGLLTLGSLLLEQMLMKGADEGQRPPKRARVRTDTGQQLWLKLAELYGHLDEWDVVRGIFRDKVQCGDSVEEALLAEATGFWREARDLYQETLQDSECLVHDYCYQALYKCLAHLSDWDRLNTNVKSQAADGDLDQLWKDSWCQEQVLPWLFSSEIQLKLSQVDPTGKTVASWPFLATVQKWLDDEDKAQHLRYNYSYMLALMYILKRDFELANHHAAQDLTLFLETWSHLSPLEDKLRTASMLDLQRSADMHVYLEFAGATNNARYQQNVTTIVDRWSHTLPCTADSLLHWDKRVMTRCGFIAQMKGRLIPMGQQSELLVQRIKNLQTEMELSLIDTALAQSNFYVARKFLERTKSKVGGGDMEQSVRWGLYFSRAKWLRAQLEDEPANQLKWTLAAWMQLDDLLESKVAQNDCTLHISIQQHQSVLARGARHHISAAPHILADIDPVSLDGLTRRVSAGSHSPEALIEGLKEFGLSCLLKATQLVKTDSLPGHQTTLVAETYLLLAQYCRSLVERDDGNQSVIYDTHIVTSILRAMKHGSRQARQLFPCLLQISSIANITKETFQKESSDVPEWMFLGWVSQLIASLDTPVGLALGDLILRLATSYPKAVIYPFYISSDKYKFKDGESAHHTRCLIERLKGVLQTSSLQDTLLKAFSCVAQPPLILKYHLDILIKFLEDEVLSLNKLRSSFHDMMAEVFSSNTSGETKLHGSVFKTVMSFKDTLLKILGENCDKVNGTNVRPAIQALKEEKAKVSAVMDSYSKKIPKLLKDFCPWLEEFQGAKFSEELEIPGQYTGEQRPLPQFHVKILGFGSQVLVMKSLRYPLRLTILGNDAKEHHYLVKFGEDLRQDQRIQQLLRLMNEILHNDTACHRHSLNICTYQVVPLTSKVGIIEWVNETKPLRQFFTDHLNQEEEMMYHQIGPLFAKWMCSVSRNKSKDIQAMERYATAYLKFNRDETVTKFQELTNRLPWDIFRRGLSALSSSPEVFFSLRHNFVLSYATMCISHWFLGIGDRHLSNCLVSQKDARCVAIDFGHSFGTATQFLPVPELFPFRLTPHIVSMMQPIEQTGFLRESMIHVVRALRKNHSILLATMEVFVLEPSIDWLELARKQNKNIHASTSFRKVDEDSWFPRQKISLARKKFEGANPAAITIEELQTGIMSSSVALKKILEVARGDAEHNIRAKLPDTSLTPEKQVDCLLDQATDYHLLGMSWEGWEPWV